MAVGPPFIARRARTLLLTEGNTSAQDVGPRTQDVLAQTILHSHRSSSSLQGSSSLSDSLQCAGPWRRCRQRCQSRVPVERGHPPTEARGLGARALVNVGLALIGSKAATLAQCFNSRALFGPTCVEVD